MKKVFIHFLAIAAFALIATASTPLNHAKTSTYLLPDNHSNVVITLTPSEVGEFVRQLTIAEFEAGIGNDAYGYIPDPKGTFYNFECFVTGGDSPWDCMMYKEEFTATSALATQGNTRYTASNLQNSKSTETYSWMRSGGDRAVTWCEGVPGPGIGERITMRVTTQGRSPGNKVGFHSIMIVNGFARNETAWKNNARVKILRLYVGDKHYCDLHLLDTSKPQIFQLPEDMHIMPHTFGKNAGLPQEWKEEAFEGSVYLTELCFEIIEVYPREKYEDTCITGIALDGYSGCY